VKTLKDRDVVLLEVDSVFSLLATTGARAHFEEAWRTGGLLAEIFRTVPGSLLAHRDIVADLL